MSALLLNFRNTIILSVVLALIMIYAFGTAHGAFDAIFWQAVFRWMHVVFGILWIGLLYYFNFVQIRKMPEIPNELKPAVSKYIAPEALFWFRWAALFTVLAGICIAALRGRDYAEGVFTLGFMHPADAPFNRSFTLMGIGVWLAIIMFLNVWGIIWPNQKIALGIKEADADAKARAARIATLASRTNTLLSLPMLTAMAMYQTFYG
ncbi:MAG TPA: urate hydroxylase PuuD [Caulobacteraceae bacterium]|nr:urate hydroxylase PuuD [Caulobacteraceae bacterium]